MKTLLARLRDRSGAAIALVALSMVALLSAVALAVDVGMMTTARTEAQRVADSSALAGAGILLANPEDSSSAVAMAINFASQNDIRGTAASVLPEDVVVDLDESSVAVTVRRTGARGNALGTFFARIFGVDEVNITAYAKARAEPIGPDNGTTCLLPIMLPDRWAESGYPGSPAYNGINDEFNPEVVDPKPSEIDDDGIWDTYVPPTDATAGNPSTGYDDSVIGIQIAIHKAGGGGGGINQSWYYPWVPLDDVGQLDDPGGSAYQARFTACIETVMEAGDLVATEPGAMVGPTNFGFDDVVALDPEMIWNETPPDGPPNGCPWRPSTASCDYTTPRVRPLPMFDPREAPESGRKNVPFTNFGSVFIETPAPGVDFQARWLGFSPTDPDDAAGDDDIVGLPKKLVLIE